jgi:hypothetical protein
LPTYNITNKEHLMTTPPKWTRITLGLLQVFVTAGALPVGLMMIINPNSALPLEMLEGSIFPNYLVPGLFLFTVNGIGSAVGAFLTFRRHRLAGLAAIGLGAFLIAWIIVQVISLGLPIYWLQPLFFAIGVAELILGWLTDPGAARALLRGGQDAA